MSLPTTELSVITYVCFWVSAHSLKSLASFEAFPGLQTNMSWTMIIMSIQPRSRQKHKNGADVMLLPGQPTAADRERVSSAAASLFFASTAHWSLLLASVHCCLPRPA